MRSSTHASGTTDVATDPLTGGLAPTGEAPPPSADFEVALESLNQWQLAWRRFKRHRMALIGTATFGFMILLAIVGPIIWPYNPLGVRSDLPGTQGFSPGQMFPFGSDGAGRSVWVLVANGARLSILIGLSTMFISVTIGTVVGAIAGYFGGRLDGFLMRLVDLFLSIPFLFVVLVAARFFGGGELIPLIVIFGVLFWPGLARLVRALFLTLREQEFVLAARAVGVGDMRIAFRHILPNAMGPIVVTATLTVAQAAKFCQCSEAHLDNLRSKGGGPRFTRIGGRRIRYLKPDLIAWMHGLRVSCDASNSDIVTRP